MSKFYQKKYISKYTGKEIDEAVAKAADAFENPMTAAGDLIVGGEDGAADKLAKGTDGKVLKMVSGAPAWADDSAGMTNPMTTAGDLIVGGADGVAERLGKGTDGQVLSMVSGAPAWAAASGGDQHLYWHTLYMASNNTTLGIFTALILNTSITAITLDDIKSLININNGRLIVLQDNGDKVCYYLFKNSADPNTHVSCKFGNASGGTTDNAVISWSGVSIINDTVTQVL